jgi:hypothetical protein
MRTIVSSWRGQGDHWWGLLAPAATPREVINKLHADFVKVLQMWKGFRQHLRTNRWREAQDAICSTTIVPAHRARLSMLTGP